MSPVSSRLTRRQFVKTATAAIGAPLLVRATALGKEGATAPSERITLGFIGAGKMAHGYHLGTLVRFDDCQALAVCDVDTTRREHAQKFVEEAYAGQDRGAKSCDAYNDYREIIARDDVDAVVIATPDHWHAIPIVEACIAGKDVYCEKPLTLTIGEAKRCIDAVRKHDRVFQTGSQQRSNVFGKFRNACEFVRSGRIGRVKTVTVGVGGPSRWCDLPEEPMEPGLDWDKWLGQAPMRPYHSVLSPRGMHNHFPRWRSYREYSGGSMTDIGAHHFDIAQWALGMDDSGPVEIIPPDDPKAGRGVKYIYANGVEMTHGGPPGCTFVGTEGTLYINRGKLEADPESVITEPLGEDEVHLYRSPGHHRDWVDCIRSRKRPICDVEIGARSVTVCHLGNLAYWYDRRLRWDPKRWQFVDDAEANTWLHREQREPYTLPEV